MKTAGRVELLKSDDIRGGERQLRILLLMRRGVSKKGAELVVDASMPGKGCIPEAYRKIQGGK